jgi:cytochrome c oxidase cbb3-type subunit 4
MSGDGGNSMDLNFIRAALTVATFASFIGICWWAYRPRSRKQFDIAARLPFDDVVPGERPLD